MQTTGQAGVGKVFGQKRGYWVCLTVFGRNLTRSPNVCLDLRHVYEERNVEDGELSGRVKMRVCVCVCVCVCVSE